MADYKLASKINGKWFNHGSFKKNQWNNYTVGLKVTPELIELIESKRGGWINLSAFEDNGERKQSSHNEAKKDGYQPQPELDDEIPFALILPLLGAGTLAVHYLSSFIA